jgi:hypothetical protein
MILRPTIYHLIGEVAIKVGCVVGHSAYPSWTLGRT